MFATGETVGLAEWIIDDTCLVVIVISLFQHLLSHAAPRPFVCSKCDAGFTTSHQLEGHMKLH